MSLVMRLALFALVPSGLLAGEAPQRFQVVVCSSSARTLTLGQNDALVEVRGCEVLRISGDRNWVRVDGGVRTLVLSGDDNVVQRSGDEPPKVADSGHLNVVLPPLGLAE